MLKVGYFLEALSLHLNWGARGPLAPGISD